MSPGVAFLLGAVSMLFALGIVAMVLDKKGKL